MEALGLSIEAIDYFAGDIEVVVGRLGYTMATGWANYCSNSIVEGHNLEQ